MTNYIKVLNYITQVKLFFQDPDRCHKIRFLIDALNKRHRGDCGWENLQSRGNLVLIVLVYFIDLIIQPKVYFF